MTKFIEHKPLKPKSFFPHFLESRSYAFKATTYGFLGAGISTLADVAAEACSPGAAPITKFALQSVRDVSFLALPLSMYMTVQAARKHHVTLSKIAGKDEADVITWASVAGVGLFHWYTGFFPPVVASLVYKMIEPSLKYGLGPVEYGVIGVAIAFCAGSAPFTAKNYKKLDRKLFA